jgi:predicted DNA-binding transcriptional regulator AlpA
MSDENSVSEKQSVATDTQSVQLLTKREVCAKVRRSFPTLWAWMRRGAFPPARDVCGRPMWVASEIDSWIAALPTRKYKNTGK